MKTMKKVSSLFLALLMMTGMCAVPAMAAETGCLNTLSDTVYTFDGEDIGDYGVVSNSEVNNTTSAETDATKFAGNRAEIVAEAEGSSNKVLKLTQANANYGVNIQPWNYSSGKSDLHISFDFKRVGTDNSDFYLWGDRSSCKVLVLKIDEGIIKLNGTNVYAYDLDTWYHIDLKLRLDIDGDIDTTEGHYAKLSVTKHGESTPTVIDLPYTKSTTDNTARDRTNFQKLCMGWIAKDTSGEVVMIDNYRQNDIDAPIPISMDSHDDSFDKLPEINYGSSKEDWKQDTIETRIGWTFVTANAGSKVTPSIENGMFKLSVAESKFFYDIMKQPFTSPLDVRHRISLKMSGYDADNGETNRSIVLNFVRIGNVYETTDPTKIKQMNVILDTQMSRDIVKFDKNIIKCLGKSGGWLNHTPDSDFMYPVELVYDAKNKVCISTITLPDGTQHEADISDAMQTQMDTWRADGVTGGDWYLLDAFGLRCMSGDGNSVAYVDDFNWDIFNDTAMTATSAVKYTGNDGSPLDETVTFDFGRPIKSKTATVSVTANGEAVTTPYTTSVESGVLSVKFSDLNLNTPYTVTVSGVTPMESDVTQAETTYTKTFETVDAAAGISATKPALDDTSISSTVTSYYAEGRPAMLIAALYKDEKLVKVITEPLDKAASRSGEVVSLDISGYDYDEIRSFVWSGFAQLLPYSGVLNQ